MRWNGVLLLLVVAIMPAPRLAAGDACSTAREKSVPAFVLAAAREGGVHDFASTLATAGVCAGFLIERNTAGAGMETRPFRDEAKEPYVGLNEVIQAFLARHPALVIESHEGFVLFVERTLDLSASPLTAVLPTFRVRSPALNAYRAAIEGVATGVVPHPDSTGAIAINILSHMDAPPLSKEDLTGPMVDVQLDRVRFLDVLVAIARQSPGSVWMLIADGRERKTDPRNFQGVGFFPRVSHPLGTTQNIK